MGVGKGVALEVRNNEEEEPVTVNMTSLGGAISDEELLARTEMRYKLMMIKICCNKIQ